MQLRLRTIFSALTLTLAACTHAPPPRAGGADDAVGAPENSLKDPSMAAESAASQPNAQAQSNGRAHGDSQAQSPASQNGKSNPAAERSSADAQPPRAELPTQCYTPGDLCLPPPDFVDRLCRAAHVGTAIRLFAKSSPFTRAYVRMREVRAVNLRGGPASDTSLAFAEEVLLLARHGGSDEMQVSGVGGYDVLRWDGTCATLSSDEVVTRVPAPPRYAPFAWKYLDDSVQEVLLQNDAIRSARAQERQRCRASGGETSASCRAAVERLNEHVVVAIRSGIELPVPEYMP